LDGNDVLAVQEAAAEAIEQARMEGGPTLLECQTYRWLGHHLADDGKYRPEDEVRYWKEQRDPIKVFKDKLLEEKELTDGELHQIHEGVDAEIQSAVQYATESEPARTETFLENIYYEESKQA
jgi:pyruvate dehydrogenase E1 component alpha subunit